MRTPWPTELLHNIRIFSLPHRLRPHAAAYRITDIHACRSLRNTITFLVVHRCYHLILYSEITSTYPELAPTARLDNNAMAGMEQLEIHSKVR